MQKKMKPNNYLTNVANIIKINMKKIFNLVAVNMKEIINMISANTQGMINIIRVSTQDMINLLKQGMINMIRVNIRQTNMLNLNTMANNIMELQLRFILFNIMRIFIIYFCFILSAFSLNTLCFIDTSANINESSANINESSANINEQPANIYGLAAKNKSTEELDEKYKKIRKEILETKKCSNFFYEKFKDNTKESSIKNCAINTLNNDTNFWQRFKRTFFGTYKNEYSFSLDYESCKDPIPWDKDDAKYSIKLKYCMIDDTKIPERIPDSLLNSINSDPNSEDYIFKNFFNQELQKLEQTTPQLSSNTKNSEYEYYELSSKINSKLSGEIYVKKISDRVCAYYSNGKKREMFFIGCHFLEDPAAVELKRKYPNYKENCFYKAREHSLSPFPVLNIMNKCFVDRFKSVLNSDLAIKTQANINIFAIFFSIFFVIKIGFNIMQGQENLNSGLSNLLKLIIIITISTQTYKDKASFEDSFLIKSFKSIGEFSSDFASSIVSNNNINPNGTNLCTFQEKDYKKDTPKINIMLDVITCKVLHLTFLDGLFSSASATIIHILFISMIVIGIKMKMPFMLLVGSLPYSVFLFLLLDFLVLYISAQFFLMILGILAPIFLLFWFFDSLSGTFFSWFRAVLIHIISPGLIIIFMLFSLNVIERNVYNTCKFTSSSSSNGIYSTKTFSLDTDKKNYPKLEDFESCNNSIGAAMNKKVGNIKDAFFKIIPLLLLLWILKGFSSQMRNYIEQL